MTFKSFSDSPKVFTFIYDFSDAESAHIASHAVMGYMLGTYSTPILENTVEAKGRLVIEYAEDKDISEVLKRICEGFKRYTTSSGISVTEIAI